MTVLTFLKKFFLVIGAVLLIAGIAAYALVRYVSSEESKVPMVYSNNALLLELWNDSKVNTIEPSSGRTLDKTQNNITTSEGQSYTMLRAVWMDDRATFDRSWQFTKNNLQRSDDHLLSWKFGQKADGNYGILTESGGQNTASDADIDTAHSLLMAYSRWNRTEYLYEARQIITSIWEKEVVVVQGKPVLVANDIERNSETTLVVNPSYFSPASFRLFAKIDTDPSHNWMGLLDNSYAILNELSTASLDKDTSVGLPPNWVLMDRRTGAITPATLPNLDTNYGYDAIRIPWRLALDYEWNKDSRSKQVLEKFSFLSKEWEKNKSLDTIYSHDGKTVANYESPAMYGTAIGYFMIVDPKRADEIYAKKLSTLYSPDRQQWKEPLNYYEDNWAWFGIALKEKALPNLATINN